VWETNDDAGKPCVWYSCKSGDKIPEIYYTRPGRYKPGAGGVKD